MDCLPIPAHGTFCDLNVSIDTNNVNNRNKAAMLVELGYEAFVLNVDFLSTENTSEKAGNKKFTIPAPANPIKLERDLLSEIETRQLKVMQFTRITIELAHVNDLLKVREVLKAGRYDVIAVKPRADRFFHLACTELDVDLICVDVTEKLQYSPRHNQVKAAVSRGVHFEVVYAPMIRDDVARVHTMTNARRVAEVTRGRNVVMSSRALIPLELRAPRDVAQLSRLFGVDDNRAIHCVQKNCRAVLVHAFARKTAKSAIYVIPAPPTRVDDQVVTSSSSVAAGETATGKKRKLST